MNIEEAARLILAGDDLRIYEQYGLTYAPEFDWLWWCKDCDDAIEGFIPTRADAIAEARHHDRSHG